MGSWNKRTFSFTLIGLCLILASCSKQQEEKVAGTPIVDIVTVKAEKVTTVNNLPGRLEASRDAVIIPRVSGIVLKRLFDEGAFVKEGDPLYKLDDGTYRAALQNAEATLKQAQANKNLYQQTVNRYTPLVRAKAISKQEYDQAVANLKTQEANITAAEAAIETAKINLDYTDIKAPIDGQIGYSEVTEGAYVNASQTQMAKIQKLNPLYINITQSAAEVIQLKQAIQNGQVQGDNANKLKLFLADGIEYPYQGQILFINQVVNESTGEVTVRASIDNPKGDLIPGLYVRVEIPQAIYNNAYLVPQQAVTVGKQNVLFVVNPDNTMAPRVVKMAGQQNNNWIITEGLKDGDRVIVDGMIPAMMAKGSLPKEDQDKFQVKVRDWVNPLIPQSQAENKAESAQEDSKSN